MVDPDAIEELATRLISQHRIVEASWVSFRLYSIPGGLPESEVENLKLAFFAGSTFMFSRLLRMLTDTGYEPKGVVLAQLQRMDREMRDYCDDVDCSGGDCS
jgi:hypothetical protein